MAYRLRVSFPHDSLYSGLEKKLGKNIVTSERRSVNIIELKVTALFLKGFLPRPEERNKADKQMAYALSKKFHLWRQQAISAGVCLQFHWAFSSFFGHFCSNTLINFFRKHIKTQVLSWSSYSKLVKTIQSLLDYTLYMKHTY